MCGDENKQNNANLIRGLLLLILLRIYSFLILLNELFLFLFGVEEDTDKAGYSWEIPADYVDSSMMIEE